MEETNTFITWPSRLKIGAKSKKGKYYLFINSNKSFPFFIRWYTFMHNTILNEKRNSVFNLESCTQPLNNINMA